VEKAGQLYISPLREMDKERGAICGEWVMGGEADGVCWSGLLAEQLRSPRVTKQTPQLSDLFSLS